MARRGVSVSGSIETLYQSFERGNASMVPRSRALLAVLIEDAALHFRLMNTLSLLEHMGSHKILATQRGASIDAATLKHIAEEAGHAWFFKRQAERLAGCALDYAPARLLAPRAAAGYFNRIEASVHRALPETGRVAVYLYTSMIVEFRAIWFYRLYQAALQHAGFALSLRRLTGEEQVHLRDMRARLDAIAALSDERVRAFVDSEQRLYASLLQALERATASDRPAAA